MKLSPSDVFVHAVLAGQRQWIIGHMYTFANGDVVDYFTDMDTDISLGGITYKSSSLRIEGLKFKLEVGIAVDEQTVTVWAAPTDTLFGGNFLTAMAEGIMDGGTIARQRVVWTPVTGDVSKDILNPPLASWQMFLGYMSTIEKLGRASIQFKVKSPLVKLNLDMPRNFYQPGCLWSLFDVGCTLDRASFAYNGTVAAGSNEIGINIVGTLPIITGADNIHYYDRGRIVFTSGVNDGLLVTLDGNNDAGTQLSLAYPLEIAPSAGDTFTAYPGCSKIFNTCMVKFNNTQNFRGFDKVPPVMASF